MEELEELNKEQQRGCNIWKKKINNIKRTKEEDDDDKQL